MSENNEIHLTEYKCKECNKFYSSQSSLCNHNKKFHKVKQSLNNHGIINNQSNTNHIYDYDQSKHNHLINLVDTNKNCIYCKKLFSHYNNKWRHEKKCKDKTNVLDELKKLKQENELLKKNNQLVPLNNTNNSGLLNNQLINIIVDKTKTIEELQTKIDVKEENKLVDVKKEKPTLNLNDVVIVSRSEDNYINATQLCQAGGKKFSHWHSLDTTKELIKELSKNEGDSDAGIPASQLLDIKKGNSNNFIQGTWIHPDLAIQLAQWISPKFALQVSKWVRTLFTTGTISVDVKLLEDKEKEIKLKDQKIQLLEDTYNKKQKRKDYPNNIIYMLTTKENKKDRIYIIGKATILKDRLSGYNKTAEHEVVYYKQCNRKSLITIEKIILTKLEKYKEKANRDRFILPVGKDISLFTDVIDSCVKFIDDKEIDL